MPTHPIVRKTAVFTILLSGLAAEFAAAQLPPVPVPPANPITEPKRLLGKILFWDEQLSSDNTVACGTCHRPANAMADSRAALNPHGDGVFNTPDDVLGSPGVARMDDTGGYIADPIFGFDPQVTSRTAQPVIGSQYAPEMFWDGRADSQFIDPQTGVVQIPIGGALESQAVGPIVSDVEMAHENRDWNEVAGKLATSSPLALATNLPADVVAGLAENPTYPRLFADAFGDPAINATRIAFAIATYERTLAPDQTPWDAFIGGDQNAMTQGQIAGWNFFRTSQCTICHAPPLFTNNTFRNVGLRPIGEDAGRFEVTGNLPDQGRFKVPTLRNTGLKTNYMHNGQLATIGQVLDFYQPANGQIQFPQNQDPLIPPINIPPPVRPGLIDFLENALTDARVANEAFPFDRPKLHSEALADLADLTGCVSGPGQAPNPGAPLSVGECLERFDSDDDEDVDLVDYARFQNFD